MTEIINGILATDDDFASLARRYSRLKLENENLKNENIELASIVRELRKLDQE